MLSFSRFIFFNHLLSCDLWVSTHQVDFSFIFGAKQLGLKQHWIINNHQQMQSYYYVSYVAISNI